MFSLKLISNSRTLVNFSRTILNSKKKGLQLVNNRNFSGSSTNLKRSEFSNQTNAFDSIFNAIDNYNSLLTKSKGNGHQNLASSLFSKRLFSTTTTQGNQQSPPSTEETNKQTLGKIEGKMAVKFKCGKCNSLVYKEFTKTAYTKGVVLVLCDGCKNYHLVIV
jgi:hypothetical protein